MATREQLEGIREPFNAARITAQEARNLSGPTVEDHVNLAYDLIRDAANKKMRQVPLTNDFWVRGGYSKTDDWDKACNILRADGFTVDFFYEERQFVNMYTIVKW